jgi:serine protease Do
VTTSPGDGSPGTDGTGRGSVRSAGAGVGSPGTVEEGVGEGAALGSVLTSIGADGTGDASAGAAGSGAASVGADGTRASSTGADGAADGWSDTAALAVVHAVASSTTASALPAAATPREAVLQTVRGRRGGLVIERKDGVDEFRLRVTRRSMSAGSGSMTPP